MEERSYNRDATISADGITVHQLYTEDEFEVPAVVLKLVSDRPERCQVRLAVPSLDADRIGFHPDFDGDAWTVRDGSLEFEADLAPDAELTTLYLIENADDAVATRALEDCRIAAVTALETAEQSAGRGAEDVIEQADSLSESGFEPVDDETGSAEPIETETAEFGTDPDDILVDPDEEPLTVEDSQGDDAVDSDSAESGVFEETESAEDSADPGESDPLATEAEPDPLATDSETDDPATPTDENTQEDTEMTASEQEQRDVSSLSTAELVSELQSRLDDGDLTPEQRRQLDAELGDGDAGDARIAHLQSRMSDIEAFSSSMEDVLDEHGPPAAVFGEFEERLEAMEAEIAEMSNEVEATAEWRETVEPRLDSVENDVEEVDESVTGMEDSVEELESEVSAIQSWREKVTGALKTFMDE
ncbi:hypothetical protein SAMN05216226_10142 [Halovenus aranensis]|uniref:Uncharacterized protein n=1 Tax=Halovenus aranensis TaxID=890420 RepID=A0A1G8RPU3_9EURY|nr:hypothetical protein [Halovenus aranensis]SDJ18923.1 hypothetical protein SAMN05216226_10142 [Halovenus aranensis]